MSVEGPPPQPPQQLKGPILACIIGNALLRAGNSATGALMGFMLASLAREGAAVGPAVVGLLAAAFYGSELFGAPWFGAQSDRRGRRPFMLAGPVFGAIAVQLIGWPRMVIAMALGRVIEGFSTASSVPSTLSYLSSATDDDAGLRTRTMAWYEMATVAGIAIGVVIGGILWDSLHSGAFLVVTGVYVASFLAFLSARDPFTPTARAGSSHAGSFFEVLSQPRLLRFAPAWLAVNTIVGTWFTHSTFLLSGEPQPGQRLSGSLGGTGVSLAFALVGGAFMVGIYLWGTFAARQRRTNVMLASVPGVYGVCLALYALNHLVDDGIGHMAITAVLLVSVAVASGFTPAALSYLADISEEAVHIRGAIMGFYSVLLGLGQLLGGLIGGPVAQFGFGLRFLRFVAIQTPGGVDGLIILTGVLGTIAGVIVIIMHRTEPPGTPAG